MHEFEDILKSDGMRLHPVQISSGPGALNRVADFLTSGPVLFLTTAGFTRRGLTQRILDLLGDRAHVFDGVTPNPRLDDLDQFTQWFRPDGFTGILAIGGGSVIDTAKVLSVTLPSPFKRPLHKALRDGRAVVWKARLPLTVVPTTSGTGAEATPFATVWDPVADKKCSLEDVKMVPANVLLDPLLTLELPLKETLYTAMDTLSHALESLWNRRRSEHSRFFSVEALERAVNALPELLSNPQSVTKRTQMQEASFLAGVAISHTRTAIAHAISYPLTLRFGMPHGLACGFTLPAILEHCMKSHVDLGVPASLIQATRDLLTEYKTTAEALKYAGAEEIISLRSQMTAPSRANNFVFPVDERLIRQLLDETFGGA